MTQNPQLGTEELAASQTQPHVPVNAVDRQISAALAGEITINCETDADLNLGDSEWQFATIIITDTDTVLTAPRDVIYPDVDTLTGGTSRMRFELVNLTPFDLTLKRSAGVGVTVATLTSALVRHDGTDIILVSAGGGGGGAASDVTFETANTGLLGPRVQDAIDELVTLPLVNSLFAYVIPNGTNRDEVGIRLTDGAGTKSAPALAATSDYESYTRQRDQTAASINSSALMRQANAASAIFAAVAGGARSSTVAELTFALPVARSDQRAFFGYQDANSAIGNVDPSSLTNSVGLAKDQGDTNAQFLVADSGGFTKHDLGVTWASLSGKLLTLRITLDDGVVQLVLQNRTDQLAYYFLFEVGTDTVPETDAPLFWQSWVNTGSATGTAVNYDLIKFVQAQLLRPAPTPFI